jgi:RNA polymerase sigma factor (TIGR02999 family)
LRPTSPYPVTDLLTRWSEGDAAARDQLVPLVYDELRRIARRCLARQRGDHTLQPTALVHEAYLRLVNANSNSAHWQNRVHFFGVAARMMRQILVDHARKQKAAKRGGGAITLVLDEDVAQPQQKAYLDLLALDDAMKRLALLDARQCQIVELRFFGGLSIEEAAQAVDISPATTKREWATARLWLHRAMSAGAET